MTAGSNRGSRREPSAPFLAGWIFRANIETFILLLSLLHPSFHQVAHVNSCVVPMRVFSKGASTIGLRFPERPMTSPAKSRVTRLFGDLVLSQVQSFLFLFSLPLSPYITRYPTCCSVRCFLNCSFHLLSTASDPDATYKQSGNFRFHLLLRLMWPYVPLQGTL